MRLFSKRPKLDAVLREHAPELLRAVYRGLLDRKADDDGLLHYTAWLEEGGTLEELLRRFSQSTELLNLASARAQLLARAETAALPPPLKSIAIFGNCQGAPLARAMQALTGTRPPTSIFVSNEDRARPQRGVEALKKALSGHDLVMMQPLYAEQMLPLVPALQGRLQLFPTLSFSAFHPDLCHVRIADTLVDVVGPMQSYHSALVYYAWQNGMGERETADLFCDAVYAQLRYHAYWPSAERALLAEGMRCGIPLESALRQWRLMGCFMHAPAHPKLPVIGDLARRLLAILEIPTLPLVPQDLVRDELAETPIWPVYPEIARQLGCEGHYVFKASNVGLPAQGSVVAYDLQAFIHHAFETYTRYRKDYRLTCTRPYTSRYQEIFGNLRGGTFVSLATPHDRQEKPSGKHPYQGLPERQFWKKAVQQVPAAELDPVQPAKFIITGQTRIATAGSCFAQHISQRLTRQGFRFLQTEQAPLPAEQLRTRNYGVYTARYGNLYTARQLLQLFERAYGELQPSESPWTRADGQLADPFRPEIEPSGFDSETSLITARVAHFAAVREMFETMEVFVFTLGLTEAWRSKVDGAVFPLAPGVVAGEMDRARHEWVNFSVAEISADLEVFVTRLAEKNPTAKIIFTVSPVSLAATYDDRHVLAATTYSKSVLRVAAEEVTRRHSQCAYFPSYEIITGHYNRGAYFAPDLRSVNTAGVDHVMRLFFAHYTRAESERERPLDAELFDDAMSHYHLVCEEGRIADAAE